MKLKYRVFCFVTVPSILIQAKRIKEYNIRNVAAFTIIKTHTVTNKNEAQN